MTPNEMQELKNRIIVLVNRAANSEKPDDAMKFAQAALNAANAFLGISNITYVK